MIYIDPPYGIKYGSNFQPFVNKRNVKDGKDEDLTAEPEMIKAFRQATKANMWGKDPQVVANAVIGFMEKKVGTLPSKLAVSGGVTRPVATAKFGKLINQTVFLRRAGAILGPVAGLALLGTTIGRTFSMAFKAGVAALEYAQGRGEQIRALEFGGTLGAGFRTQSAATERQRAVQAINRTHLSGRRALGHEAVNYHALI